jgi:hypothetical protein
MTERRDAAHVDLGHDGREFLGCDVGDTDSGEPHGKQCSHHSCWAPVYFSAIPHSQLVAIAAVIGASGVDSVRRITRRGVRICLPVSLAYASSTTNSVTSSKLSA